MEIIQIVAFGIVASLLYILIKEQHAPLAFFLILLAGIFIFIVVIQQIAEVIKLVEYLGQKANVNGMYIETILKIIGIAYVAEFGAHITRDAGLSSVAAKIELAGKVFILVLAVPILTAVIETIVGFIPT
ncbi:stage III sporulation protein AD [Aquibacillus sp. 3ASR75-11]|uniref:Stage III sporulation protein AD n=1 Tax=Terrihalobacillus insolitus TaxID=2950438 RepID=A0A9X4AP90_9BACI|nr:stage III sporulation protein AD [Terrihalobacillus insolitus]MDC3414425.1 stage III sporulation protein AD [Terrihalobacillus insolitus]MDC3425305.1 stage III sporulation protein AD [Terrihalobacillus insolitus]